MAKPKLKTHAAALRVHQTQDFAAQALACLTVELQAEPSEGEVRDAMEELLRQCGLRIRRGEMKLALTVAKAARLRELQQDKP